MNEGRNPPAGAPAPYAATATRRLIPLVAAALILAALYWRINPGRIVRVLSASDKAWMAAAFAMLAPLVLAAAVRLVRLVPVTRGISLPEAIELNLAAATLNLALPSKMGDLAKGWFFRQRGHLSGSQALALVLFERGCDVLALFLWCAAGLAVLPRRSGDATVLGLVIGAGLAAGLLALVSRACGRAVFGLAERWSPPSWRGRVAALRDAWETMQEFVWRRPARTLEVALESLGIWFVNLFQVWMFIRALGVAMPVMDAMALAPLGILAGLAPVTFGGAGTRDAATIYFFRAYFDPATGAALGVLLTARYLLLGLAGLPFLRAMSGGGEPAG